MVTIDLKKTLLGLKYLLTTLFLIALLYFSLFFFFIFHFIITQTSFIVIKQDYTHNKKYILKDIWHVII